jgi:hypothetical protein
MKDHQLEPLTQEHTDLSLHVDLCAKRYYQLIAKFEEVDSRLKGIDATLGEIKSSIENHTTVNYLKWAGSAIFVLSMALIGLVTKLLAN